MRRRPSLPTVPPPPGANAPAATPCSMVPSRESSGSISPPSLKSGRERSCSRPLRISSVSSAETSPPTMPQARVLPSFRREWSVTSVMTATPREVAKTDVRSLRRRSSQVKSSTRRTSRARRKSRPRPVQEAKIHRNQLFPFSPTQSLRSSIFNPSPVLSDIVFPGHVLQGHGQLVEVLRHQLEAFGAAGRLFHAGVDARHGYRDLLNAHGLLFRY